MTQIKTTIAAFLIGTVGLFSTMAQAAESFELRDAEEQIREAVLDKVDSDNIKFDVLRLSIEGNWYSWPLQVSDSEATRYTISMLSVDETSNRIEGELVAEKGERTIAIQGRYLDVVDVPALSEDFGRDTVIKASDIVWIQVPERNVSRDIARSEQDLIGKTVRRLVAGKKPLKMRDLASPQLVAKDSQVQLVYVTPFMELRTFGKAEQAGAVGDVIRVTNEQSNKTVRGRVQSDGMVVVSDSALANAVVQPNTAETTSVADVK